MMWHNQQSYACMLAQKLALPQKDMTWQTVTESAAINEPTDVSQKSLSDGRDTDISTVFWNSPR